MKFDEGANIEMPIFDGEITPLIRQILEICQAHDLHPAVLVTEGGRNRRLLFQPGRPGPNCARRHVSLRGAPGRGRIRGAGRPPQGPRPASERTSNDTLS